MENLRKLRTIDQIYNTIKEMDPETAISKWFIREAILNGEIPFLQVRTKRLIDIDDVLRYINANMKDMTERVKND